MAETYWAQKSREYRERHPERVRAANLARNDYKREWEAGECYECGGESATGRYGNRCGECRREAEKREARDRTIRFIALRKKGMLNSEIAELAGVSRSVVNCVLSRAWRYGLDAGKSPYFKAPA